MLVITLWVAHKHNEDNMNRFIWYTIAITIIIGCGETSTISAENTSSDSMGEQESSSSLSSERELLIETLSSSNTVESSIEMKIESSSSEESSEESSSSSMDESSETDISSEISEMSSESTPVKISSSSMATPSSAEFTIETEYIYRNGNFAFAGEAWNAVAWSTDSAHVFDTKRAITDNPKLSSAMHLTLTSTGGLAMPLNEEWSIDLTEYESIQLEYKSADAITLQVQTKGEDADSILVVMGQAQLNIAASYTSGSWKTVAIPIKDLLASGEVDMTDITVLVFSNYFEDTIGGDYYIGNIALLRKVLVK